MCGGRSPWTGGKFCPSGIPCRLIDVEAARKTLIFQGLLPRHGACSILCGITRRDVFRQRPGAEFGTMLFAIGAASNAVDLLSSLLSGSPAPSTATTSAATTPNAFSPVSPAPATTAPTTPVATGTSTSGQLAPTTLDTLLSAQSQTAPTLSQSSALQSLFSLLDSNGDGSISKSEFESALGAGGTNLKNADAVFAQIDTNGDGSISQSELQNALEGSTSPQGAGQAHGHHHHHHGGGGGGAGGAEGSGDALQQALQGATSTSSTNSDGSTTTTLTYADGTKITMTQPAASTASAGTTSPSSSAAQQYNFTEQLIQRQAQLIAANAQQSLSVSV
jgi:hypothetical protein